MENIGKKIGWGIAGLLLVVTLVTAIYSVPPGHRGVKVTLNKVENVSLPNGIGLKWPWGITKVRTMNVQIQAVNQKSSSYTADMQTAQMQYTVKYEVNPANVHTLYEKVGADYFNKEIQPAVYGVLKDIVGTWKAQDLVNDRDSARFEVIALLTERVKSDYFQNISFEFDDIEYSEKFEQAIEDKVISEQKVLQAQFDTQRIEEINKQKRSTADADKYALDQKGEALRKNKDLIEYEWINKWNGILPQVSLGENSMPVINLQPTK